MKQINDIDKIINNLKEIIDKCPNTYPAYIASVTIKIINEHNFVSEII